MQNSMTPRIVLTEELMDRSMEEGLITEQEWELAQSGLMPKALWDSLYQRAALAMLDPDLLRPN